MALIQEHKRRYRGSGPAGFAVKTRIPCLPEARHREAGVAGRHWRRWVSPPFPSVGV